jgi:thiol-disulfide isomerase/thioredoxin
MIIKIEKYGANWCGPCKVLDKTLETLKNSKEFNNIEIVKYDIEENEELTIEKGIRNVPVLIFYNENNEETNRTVGAIPANKILEIINK